MLKGGLTKLESMLEICVFKCSPHLSIHIDQHNPCTAMAVTIGVHFFKKCPVFNLFVPSFAPGVRTRCHTQRAGCARRC